jgi:6-pyruvoyltetrahydropterin/6-carboxytetrahydropterin synthase
MKTTITKRWTFEAAHFLPYVADGHKCKRMHGHNYEIEVTVTNEMGLTHGFILDFLELNKMIQPLIEEVDHRVLNDVRGLENPTAELIAYWFNNRIKSALGMKYRCIKVVVFETKDCWATVEENPEDRIVNDTFIR